MSQDPMPNFEADEYAPDGMYWAIACCLFYESTDCCPQCDHEHAVWSDDPELFWIEGENQTELLVNLAKTLLRHELDIDITKLSSLLNIRANFRGQQYHITYTRPVLIAQMEQCVEESVKHCSVISLQKKALQNRLCIQQAAHRKKVKDDARAAI